MKRSNPTPHPIRPKDRLIGSKKAHPPGVSPALYRILFIAAEFYPLVKVGGLADVAGSLPKALASLGHSVRVVIPLYPEIDPTALQTLRPVSSLMIAMPDGDEEAQILEGKAIGGVAITFIRSKRYFDRENVYGYSDDDERFVFFNKALVHAIEHLEWNPDVVHCNDWHSALVPDLLEASQNGDEQTPASVLTIHNLAHQGPFTSRTREAAGVGPEDLSLNLMARGILSADVINTVSSRYAAEILTPKHGSGLDPLLRDRRESFYGILNGLDYEEFSPSCDPHVAVQYDGDNPEKRRDNKHHLQTTYGLEVAADAPLVGMVCRLDDQKGLDLVAEAMHDLIRLGVQFIAMGLGAPKYVDLIHGYVSRYPGQVIYCPTSDESVARKIYSGVDFILAPSKFEPCGLSPLIALRYGAIPIVRKTGGMAETIIDHHRTPGLGLGFVFEKKTAAGLLGAIRRALHTYRHPSEWKQLVARAMGADFSWEGPAQEYEILYQHAIEKSRSRSKKRKRAG
ncbi:glycogen synthase [Myxococcota bacterium]|nr:glycogen synthase [Myxococcota bacterium]